jgi:hypothetical protein
VITSQSKLDLEIDRLKRMLESTAAEYKYNFGHPKVLKISQKLDGLIVKQMKHNTI